MAGFIGYGRKDKESGLPVGIITVLDLGADGYWLRYADKSGADMVFIPETLVTGRSFTNLASTTDGGIFSQMVTTTGRIGLMRGRREGEIDLSYQRGAIAAGDLPASSETASGAIELATQAEITTGTDDLRAVTPLKLAVAKLTEKRKVVSESTTPYTILATDHFVQIDATSGTITAVLPTAVGIEGVKYSVIKIDVSANAVTLDGDGSETINGAANVALAAQFNVVEVISDGANWIITSSNIA